MNRWKDRQTRYIHCLTDEQVERQTERYINSQTDGRTERQTDTWLSVCGNAWLCAANARLCVYYIIFFRFIERPEKFDVFRRPELYLLGSR